MLQQFLLFIFLIYFAFSLNGLFYSSFLGGEGYDYGGSIIYHKGDIIIVGTTESYLTFPFANEIDDQRPGTMKIFITRINGTTHEMVFSTLFGATYPYDILTYVSQAVIREIDDSIAICGYLSGSGFPIVNPYQQDWQGYRDGFVTVLSFDGQEVLYSSSFGDLDGELFFSIDSLSDGRLAIGGAFYYSFVFVLNITAEYDEQVGYMTRFCTPSGDDTYVKSVYVKNDIIYATGYSNADSLSVFPSGGLIETNPGPISAIFFVFEVNPLQRLYGSFLGGSGTDYGYTVFVDDNQNTYIYGTTNSDDFNAFGLITPGVIYPSHSSLYTSLFLLEFDSSFNLLHGTYFPDADYDCSSSVSVDGIRTTVDDKIVMMGMTSCSHSSKYFPTTSDAFQPERRSSTGFYEGFVVILEDDFSSVIYGSFVGENNLNYGMDIDPAGNIFLTGFTSSQGFPTTPDALQASFQGGTQDGFFVIAGGIYCSYGYFNQSCNCTACSPGTYSNSMNSSSCTLCDYNQFQNASAADSCYTCEDGAITLQQGSTSSSDCVFIGAPNRITQISLTFTNQSVIVDWEAPYDGGLPITNYTLNISHEGILVHSYEGILDTYYQIDNLSSLTNYSVEIVGFNANGMGNISFPVNGTTSGVPGNITVINATQTQKSAYIFWDEPTTNGGEIELYYLESTPTIDGLDMFCTQTNFTIVLDTLPSSTTFNISVKARNVYGNGSFGDQNTTSLQTFLTWDKPLEHGSPIQLYEVSFSPLISGGNVNTTLTNLTVEQSLLQNAQEYQVKIRAMNAIGFGLFGIIFDFVSFGYPDKVKDIQILIGIDFVYVSCDSPNDNGVNIDRFDMETYPSIAQLSGSSCEFSIPIGDFETDLGYQIKIRAHNDLGEGEWSEYETFYLSGVESLAFSTLIILGLILLSFL
ncbi:cell surface glycoprotein (s-layer protein)-like protein [Anaeramoeba ignava]|uniref:Cell surface glycoprotein (S-layer protein)-like protein n=1 Tax=Anaeramoeba ignava TaxID=1746090 RepID=A0A9Q0LJZ5_ANAIG|nr:cell surface glycoprotein (s-layer protein)-like protein [Anaeramoeba ignava]